MSGGLEETEHRGAEPLHLHLKAPTHQKEEGEPVFLGCSGPCTPTPTTLLSAPPSPSREEDPSVCRELRQNHPGLVGKCGSEETPVPSDKTCKVCMLQICLHPHLSPRECGGVFWG